ncbi:hypothetical protein CK203_073275 [Vitis vinifera]|uniref:Uncharacterized protein n=1 Tax=Vitis vinifera TaxID=29760 RepID=A0A438ENM4_VITVI|nr:hypothetical protein CK203_073275 [Vitis vinifera]
MKGNKASILTAAERCKNILASNWQGRLNTIKADAKGSKADIYSSKVNYMVKRGKPYIWVPENDLHNVGSEGGFGVGFWKEIRKEGSLLQNKVVFSMGDGRRVKFWKDKWCGNFALCDFFPSLYALAASKEAWLVELWDSSGEEGGWSPRFSRPFNDWEVESALDSRSAVQFPKSIIWSPCVPTKNTIIDERGSFSVASPYPGPLANLLRSMKKLPARVALTGDVVPLKDEKVNLFSHCTQ